MTDEQKQQIKKQIAQDFESLNREVADLQEKTKPIPPDCCLGDLRFEMMHEQEVFERTLHEAKIRINKLKYALGKIDKEGYGFCMECDEEIPFGRLLILPESMYCTACASNK
ncbi:transcriptional regulator, TraR/DksA family [Epsilonproteobacteria bacterium SCGC AD-308-O04]|jgi:DnaK suppressor protein|nr:transcriptional regulator, TraR/DksA family [Epsilonproteobacteria bacterium SCGC AD-308-O04]